MKRTNQTEPKVDVRGDLAGILRIATNAKTPGAFASGISQVELVAGSRCIFSSTAPGSRSREKANGSRAIDPPIDWRLYKERHQVECFFNKLKRFRRIALRCEKALTAFMGFVHLACAMIWLR